MSSNRDKRRTRRENKNKYDKKAKNDTIGYITESKLKKTTKEWLESISKDDE
jgi:hypothetical protein